jgi:hypothetical protein
VWRPTALALARAGTPFVVTDYTEEAACLAFAALERVHGEAAAAAAAGGGATVDVPYPASVGRLTRPRLNPFRSPVSARGSDNALPTYSNAFVFGWGVDL